MQETLVDTSEIVTTDNTKEEKNEAIETNEPTNKIYDYFKKHPSLFITFSSAFIAGISVLLKLIAFLNVNTYLNFFNVENSIYKQSTQFAYFIAISLVFFATFALFMHFVSKTFRAYLPYKERYLFFKYSSITLNKEKKHITKKIKQSKKLIKNFSKSNKKDNAIIDLEEDVRLLNGLAEKCKTIKKSLNKSLNETRLLCYIMVGLSCLLTCIVFFFMYVAWFSITTYEWEKTLQSGLTFSITYVIICAIENWLIVCAIPIKRKKIKQDAQDTKNSKLENYSNYEQFPLSSLVNGKFSDIFSDTNCKMIIFTIVLSLIILLLLSIYSGSKVASTQNEFFIVNIEDQQYAIIYDNGEDAIIEKSEFTETDIIINTNHQKTISSKNIDKTKYVFDNVQIVRDTTHYDANKTESSKEN